MIAAHHWWHTAENFVGIFALIIAATGVVGLFYGARWKAAALVEGANAEAWEDTAHRLQEQVSALQERLASAEAKIAELAALPDITAVHTALLKHDEEVAKAMREHDAHAEQRTQRLIDAIKESA